LVEAAIFGRYSRARRRSDDPTVIFLRRRALCALASTAARRLFVRPVRTPRSRNWGVDPENHVCCHQWSLTGSCQLM
jgi:hypothetical protein